MPTETQQTFYDMDIFNKELKRFYAGAFNDVARRRAEEGGKKGATESYRRRESVVTTCATFCLEYEALCAEADVKNNRPGQKIDKEATDKRGPDSALNQIQVLVRARKKTFETKYKALWEMHGKNNNDTMPEFGHFKRAGKAVVANEQAYKDFKKLMGF